MPNVYADPSLTSRLRTCKLMVKSAPPADLRPTAEVRRSRLGKCSPREPANATPDSRARPEGGGLYLRDVLFTSRPGAQQTTPRRAGPPHRTAISQCRRRPDR